MKNIYDEHIQRILQSALTEGETLKKNFLIQSVLHVITLDKQKEKENA